MRHVISASLFVLACALAQPAFAQLEDKPVPMERAPFHIPVFSERLSHSVERQHPARPQHRISHPLCGFRLGQSRAPPPRQTRITARTTSARRALAERAHLGGRPLRMSPRTGPRTHKASNVGPTPFHNISFILKKPAGGNTVSDRNGVNGFTQIMDNARLRAWRIVLMNLDNRPVRSPRAHRVCASMSMAACSLRSFRATPIAAWRPLTGRFHLERSRGNPRHQEHWHTTPWNSSNSS